MCVCHACVTGCRCVLSVFVHVDDWSWLGGGGQAPGNTGRHATFDLLIKWCIFNLKINVRSV